MIDLIQPFSESQLDDLRRCRFLLQRLIDGLDASEYRLSILDGDGNFDDQKNRVNQKILRWERRNRNIMHSFLYRYDLTRLVQGIICDYARSYFSEDVMLSHVVYVRTETPCGKLYGCRTHVDELPVPFLTFWMPFHDLSHETGGLSFESQQLARWESRDLKEIPCDTGETYCFPALNFGDCLVFDSIEMHAGTSAKDQTRSSIDIRISPFCEANSYNDSLELPYVLNGRGRYIPVNYSSIESFRSEQLRHLDRLATLEDCMIHGHLA